MFIDIDKWQEILDSLRKQKWRTALTAFGVFWGIFMLVILLGFGSGLGYKIENAFGDAKNAVFLWSSNSTQLSYQGMGKGRRMVLKQADVDAIKHKVPGIATIEGKNNLGSWGAGQYVVYGKKSGSFGVMGTHPHWESFEFLRIIEGRYINAFDQSEKRKVAVIGTRVKTELFKQDENPIGKAIEIQGLQFTVIGIYQSTDPDGGGDQANGRIYLPNNTVKQAFNQLDWFGFILFTPKEGYSSYDVEHDVKKVLYERNHIHPDDTGVFAGFNMEKIYQDSQNLVNGIVGFSWLVAIGTLIAGVIGVGNIMLIVVKERTREIGLRKALGATPFKISGMIIHESLVITLVAGYSGLVAGVLLLEGITAILIKLGQGDGMFSSPFIDIGTAITAMLVLVVIGALAALLPAMKAAAVNPIIALQDE
jgi:putative ABC transport system permease protein